MGCLLTFLSCVIYKGKWTDGVDLYNEIKNDLLISYPSLLLLIFYFLLVAYYFLYIVVEMI